jgi:glutamate/aspartate transport system substrate-binding protein
MLEDITLLGSRMLAHDPSNWVITGTVQSEEPYAFVFRKGDAVFKQLVDESLTKTFQSPEIQRIYSRWFEQPIPPKNINLQMQMSPELSKLYSSPNDRPAY